MSDTVQNQPPALLRAASVLRKGIDCISRLMAYAAGWTFVACALFICGDIIGRSFFGISSASTVEMSGYMLACGISWALANTLAERAHVRVDVLVNHAPETLQAFLHVFALVLLFFFSIFIAWAGLSLVEESLLFSAHDSSAFYTPLAIPQSIWLIGLAALAVMSGALLIEAILLVATGRLAEVVELLHARTINDEAEEALDAVSALGKGSQ